MTKIKYYRLLAGRKLEEVAADVGLCPATVSRMEKDGRYLNYERAEALAKALSVKITDICEVDTEPKVTAIRLSQDLNLGDKIYVIQQGCRKLQSGILGEKKIGERTFRALICKGGRVETLTGKDLVFKKV